VALRLEAAASVRRVLLRLWGVAADGGTVRTEGGAAAITVAESTEAAMGWALTVLAEGG
jgi:hypothetical protein